MCIYAAILVFMDDSRVIYANNSGIHGRNLGIHRLRYLFPFVSKLKNQLRCNEILCVKYAWALNMYYERGFIKGIGIGIINRMLQRHLNGGNKGGVTYILPSMRKSARGFQNSYHLRCWHCFKGAWRNIIHVKEQV